MIDIRIADLNIRLHNRYGYTEELCREYVTDAKEIDFEVRVTEDDIAKEIKDSDSPVDEAYAESVCLHREIADRLWKYDAFLLHAALIECDGRGYAFAARSGVGKSTHITLWRKNFGRRVRAINGDKPIIRMTEQGPVAYGTPWNGKERLGENRSCALNALCFLERGEKNEIQSISMTDGVLRMFNQLYFPRSEEAITRTMDLVDSFAQRMPFFRLFCNMEDDAAIVAHEAMSNC